MNLEEREGIVFGARTSFISCCAHEAAGSATLRCCLSAGSIVGELSDLLTECSSPISISLYAETTWGRSRRTPLMISASSQFAPACRRYVEQVSELARSIQQCSGLADRTAVDVVQPHVLEDLLAAAAPAPGPATESQTNCGMSLRVHR